jgi:hypothetical protein
MVIGVYVSGHPCPSLVTTRRRLPRAAEHLRGAEVLGHLREAEIRSNELTRLCSAGEDGADLGDRVGGLRL